MGARQLEVVPQEAINLSFVKVVQEKAEFTIAQERARKYSLECKRKREEFGITDVIAGVSLFVTLFCLCVLGCLF